MNGWRMMFPCLRIRLDREYFIYYILNYLTFLPSSAASLTVLGFLFLLDFIITKPTSAEMPDNPATNNTRGAATA
jgi:hypothetical protein